MVHSAYDSFELLPNCPAKISTVASHGSKLFLACSDGSLRIYTPESFTEPSPPKALELEIKREPYVLQKTINGFWRKPVVAMEVLGLRGLMVSLSESIVVHRLPKLEVVAAISKAKGANVYAWDDRRGFLCFGRQKRVWIFRLEGERDFVEVKDFGVPDVVKSMAWCGENICLGIRREYMILNTTNGTMTEVFSSGRTAPPLVVSLPSDELLLGKDNIGVFVDQHGKLLQEGRVVWSEAPTSVAVHMQNAIAGLPRHIEIRSLRVPCPLVQTVVLREANLVQSNGNVIIVVENSIYGLLPVPLGAQIVQLTASGNFEDALALCKLLPPEDSKLREAKEGSIHIRYGHHLFESGSYEEAMEQFFAASVDITYVLSLYPEIVLPKSSSSAQIANHKASEALDLTRVSADASGETILSHPSHLLEPNEKATLDSTKMSYNALTALVKYLQKKREDIIEKATTEGTEEVVSEAVGYGIEPYNSSRLKNSSKTRRHINISSGAREMASIMDTALLQVLVLTGQSSASLDLLAGVNYCDVKICEEFLRQQNCYSALLELYKANEMHHEALKLLNQLIEEPNLVKSSPGLVEKFEPKMIIEYLKPLCSSDPMLVLEYSMHALESCPTQTIELLLSGNISPDLVNSYLKQHMPKMQATYLEHLLSMNESGISPNLQNELVQMYLSEVLDWYASLTADKDWDEKCYSSTRKKLLSALENMSGYKPEALLKRLPADALYEERALLLGKMNQHQFALSLYVHKLHVPELALAYCDRVYEAWQHQHSPKSYSSIYLILLQIFLNPPKTAEIENGITNLVIPQTTGSEKVGSTKPKVSRGIKNIVEIEGAEDERFSSSYTDTSRSDCDGDEPMEARGPIMLAEALDLLGQRWDRINGAQALKLLPRDTKLQSLLSFLEPLLKKSSEGRRNLSVIKSLRYSDNVQVKEKLYEQRKAVVKVTSDSTCSLCNKRMGTSVFAVYPNGKTLVHFVCFRDSQSIKAVRGASFKKRG